MSQIPVSKERKCPKFRSARNENIPNSDQQETKMSQIPISKGRKGPKFYLACGDQNVPIMSTKRSQIQTMMQQ